MSQSDCYTGNRSVVPENGFQLSAVWKLAQAAAYCSGAPARVAHRGVGEHLPPFLRVLNFFAVELQGMQSSADGVVDCLFPDRLMTLQPLFQVLVDRLGHLKHVQFLTAKDRLQLIVGQDFSFVLWILKFVLLNVRPNLFCDFSSRQWFCANNFGQVL
jgi:hypothetical protein